MISTDSFRRPNVRRSLAAVAAAAVLVAGCGSSDDSASSSNSGDTADESVSSAAEPDDATVSDEGSADTDDAAEETAGEDVQQNGPISVEGDPLVPFDGSAEDPAVGQQAPVLSGESFDGTPITIGGPGAQGAAASSENATMVVFLAHWCPHCNDEVPELISLEEAGEIPEDLDVIGVSTAVDPSGPNYPPSEWIVEKGWPWPTMADDEELAAFMAYGGTSFPFTVVLDADGVVLARRAGSATAEDTTAFLADALGG